MNTLPAVAKKVFYTCKKCETDRYQVVVTHMSENTAKLECEVCKTKNSFKLEEPKISRARSAVPKKKTTKSVGARAAASVAKWNELREQSSEKPKPYSMKNVFEVGSVVEHPKFGLGFVVQISTQAMQVIFEDGERSLVHNRP